MHFLGLRRTATDDHAADGVVRINKAEIPKVFIDIRAQILNVLVRFVDIGGIKVPFFKMEILLNIIPLRRIDLFALYAQGIAVGDGLIIKVLVDVVTEFQVAALPFR